MEELSSPFPLIQHENEICKEWVGVVYLTRVSCASFHDIVVPPRLPLQDNVGLVTHTSEDKNAEKDGKRFQDIESMFKLEARVESSSSA